MIAKTFLFSLAAMLMTIANAEYDVGKYCKLVVAGTKLPSLSSCTAYYICQDNGIPIQASCSGTTVFSKNEQNCVPATANNCYYGLKNPCQFKDKEFAPSNKGCNMWNYCLNGEIAGSGSCPLGQLFYAPTGACINGNCQREKGQDGEIKNLCEIMPDGVFFGDYKDCKTWRKCNAMSIKSGKCNDNLVFDTKTGMCLKNKSTMCERTHNAVTVDTSGPPKEACTNVNQIVGDTNVCSVYYECKASPNAPTGTYEWVEKSCYKSYFDVITKQCNSTRLARAHPGCNRCQFTTGNPYWVNVVDKNCEKYLTCNNGAQVSVNAGSCGKGNFFNQALQVCVNNGDDSSYEMSNGACQDYSCTDARECSLTNESNSNATSSDNGTIDASSGNL